MINYQNTIFVGLFFLIFLILLELAKRRFKINSEYSRKFAHIIGGMFVIFSSGYINKNGYLILTIIFLIIFIISRRNKLLTSFSDVSRKTFGEITYLMGLFILGYVFFDQKIYFVPSLLILIFPDSVAGLVGYQINRSKKTLVGSVIYFSIAIVILSFFFPIFLSLGMALALTIIEFVSPYGFDNLTIPVFFILLIKLLF